MEAEETFRIRLEVPASESGVQLGVSEATVLLVDADGKQYTTTVYCT